MRSMSDEEVKRLVTSVFVSTVLGWGTNAATLAKVKRIVEEQRLDAALADRLMNKFVEENDLQKVKFTYQVRSKLGPHFHPLIGSDGRVAGPSAATTKKALDKKEHSGHIISIDDPAIRLHEFGHALSRSKDSWSASPVLRVTAAVLGLLGSFAASATGHPWVAGLVSLLGSSPVLAEEWKASDYAREFLKQNVPKAEAERAGRMLDHAFHTYLINTAGSIAKAISMGYIMRKSQV